MNSVNLVKIATLQLKALSSKSENIAKQVDEIRKIAKQGAQIVCLQELFQTLYFCDEESESGFDLADEIAERAVFYGSLCKELNIVLVASLFEKRAAGLYHNTAIVVDADGTFLGSYRKKHIPDDPGFYEKYYFSPGDDDYKCFKTAFGNVGVLVCWDQWYPEAARLTALKGADILFYPTAIGWELNSTDELKDEEYNAWKVMHQSHAVANGVHVVAVNRVGTEVGTQFWGGSLVIEPFGKTIYKAGLTEESVITTIDLSKTEATRRRWPFLRDRRIDTYQSITKRWDSND